MHAAPHELPGRLAFGLRRADTEHASVGGIDILQNGFVGRDLDDVSSELHRARQKVNAETRGVLRFEAPNSGNELARWCVAEHKIRDCRGRNVELARRE